MKLSVSLPSEDVEFLDEYARTQGYRSRSAVVHAAVRMLRSAGLGESYAEAWQEWSDSGECNAWAAVAGDGMATG